MLLTSCRMREWYRRWRWRGENNNTKPWSSPARGSAKPPCSYKESNNLCGRWCSALGETASFDDALCKHWTCVDCAWFEEKLKGEDVWCISPHCSPQGPVVWKWVTFSEGLSETFNSIPLSRNTSGLSKVLLKYTPRKPNYINRKWQPKSIFKEVDPIAG